MNTDLIQSSTLAQSSIQPVPASVVQGQNLQHVTPNPINNGLSNVLGNGINSNNMAGAISDKSASANVTQVSSSDNLFVANLQAVSLEKLVRSKLEVLFQQQKESEVDLSGLYKVVVEQVEKPLLELALKCFNGNQVKTAKMLGINRNTLKKKIDCFKIKVTRNK